MFFFAGLSEDDCIELSKEYLRPKNCAAVTSVKVNQLVWDVCAHKIQTMDVRMQTIQTAFAKAGRCLTQLAEKVQGEH